MEGKILLLGHGAIDIILAIALRADLVPAACNPANVHVDAVAIDDRRNGIEKGERFLSGGCADAFRKAHVRKGAVRHNRHSGMGQRLDTFPNDVDQERKSAVKGKVLSVRVDLGGIRIIKKKKK